MCLAIGAIAATVSILFWAWLIVWFQLFGEQPDRADLEASGLYAGGLVWLALMSGIVALVRRRAFVTRAERGGT